jgi:PKD repeat protein
MRSRTVPVLLLAGLFVLASLVVAGSPATSRLSEPVASSPVAAASPVPAPTPETVQVAPAFSANSGVRDLGPVAGSAPLDVVVGVAPQNAAGLSAYLTALYLPGSPVYHQFLSVPTLAARYGAAPGALASAQRYFESYGLHVAVSPDRLLLDVDGPATEIGPAFDTVFDAYATDTGRTFVSHPTPAELPGSVPWTGAFGLGNATPLTPDLAPSATEVPLAGPATSCSGGPELAPCQVWGAYNMSATITGGTDGSGQTIGIVDAYDASEPQDQLEEDLALFDTHFSLPSPAVTYLYPVPSNHDLNTTYTQWGDEEALDLQWAHASAPGAAIDMTFSPNPGAGLYEAVDYLVSHQAVNVISMSWGEPDTGVYNAFSSPCLSECNASTDGTYALLAPVLEFAAAEGISVFAATGDCGAADGTSGDATNFPASDPYVTGVGGTVLSVSNSGSWEGETGWSGNATGATSPGCLNQGGSGGGFSPFPRPWWQTGSGLPTGGSTRGAPDVSAVALPGVVIYYGNHSTAVGGTSLATPIWAGITAIADQYTHRELGFLNPTLYQVFRGPDYLSAFHDVTSGNNGYSAGTGWDPVTGIGTPIVAALLPDLTSTPSPPTTLTADLNVSRTAGPAPLTVTFSVGASGGSGPYPVEGVYFGDGTAAFTSGGSVNHTYRAPGVYPAQGYVFDRSGNSSTSSPVAVLVGGGSALSVNLSASSTDPAAGAEVTLTTTVSGGTSPYSYLYSFGDGTYQNWSADSSIAHVYGINGSFCAEVLVNDSSTPPDGGMSLAVPIGVGSAPSPTCAAPPTPLVVTPDLTPGVRDAPAEFPSLFQITGGAGTLSLHYQSSDPYVAACGCTLFRSSGNDSVWLYANESGGPPVVSETNVTVAPPLNVTFAASSTFGAAPLTVDFNATVTGGYEVDPSAVNWSFGNGQTAVGQSEVEVYSDPGTYWAVGHLSDRGHGNASEAFLIDVGPAGPSAVLYLTATIAPAMDVPSGGTVEYAASAHAWDGSSTPANFTWSFGNDVAGYSADVNRTYYAPAEGADSYFVAGTLSATFLSTGANQSVPFALGGFFAVESGGFVPGADALHFSDSTGPDSGPHPLSWTGTSVAAGPGTLGFTWAFGDGTEATGAGASHTYSAPGTYTATLRVTDSWGDQAVDAAGVDVTNGPAAPLALVSSPSVESGPAPLTVTFSAVASGGSGPPYTYAWEFGDGTGADTGNVTYTYDSVGTFTATITVHDAHGAAYNRSYSIVVESPASGGGPVFGFLPRSFSLALLAVVPGVAIAAILVAVSRRARPPTSDRAPSIP